MSKYSLSGELLSCLGVCERERERERERDRDRDRDRQSDTEIEKESSQESINRFTFCREYWGLKSCQVGKPSTI
jgi:hypothetical protein